MADMISNRYRDRTSAARGGFADRAEPAMKRTAARLQEDPDSEGKRLAETLGRRGA